MLFRHVVGKTLWSLAIAFAIAIPTSLLAQNGQVTGTITDRDTGAPLATVQVYLQGTSIAGLSSATGTFSLANVPPGTYTVIAQRIGYTQTRQADVAVRAGVSRSFVSLIERGHLDRVSLATLRRVAAVLDIRIDLIARWRGGELDRLLNAGHSAVHESVARFFLGLPDWMLAPEVTFAIWGPWEKRKG